MNSSVTEDLHGYHTLLFANLSNTFYGSLGNHDTAPTNDFPRTTAARPDDAKWVYDLLSEDWERWVGPRGATMIQHHSGSYAVVHPGTKLKLIAVNTQFWYRFNFWLYDSDDFQPDPNGVLSFLRDELHSAEVSGQRAWIFGHIPPGAGDAFRDQSNYYDQIIQRFKHTIAGQFFGHTHIDQFHVGYSDYEARTAENAMTFGLVAPSLTPTNGNPAFTVYDVDPDTYEIMDSKVYIANMSEPDYHEKPTWSLLYSARESYGPLVGKLTPSDPLNATFWHKLTDVFVANDTAFELYINRTTRMSHTGPCTGRCKDRVICDIRKMRSEDSCYIPNVEDNLPWHDDERSDGRGDCEGSSVPSILRRLIASDVSLDDLR